MKKLSIFFVLVIILSGCNKKELEKLQNQVNSLEAELNVKVSIIDEKSDKINELYNEISELQEQLNKLQQKKMFVRQYTDKEIIQLIKKEREFECPHLDRKDWVVRKLRENYYEVRYMHKNPKYPHSDYRPSIYSIEFLPENKYKTYLVSGSISC
jgi:hypothetical protein